MKELQKLIDIHFDGMVKLILSEKTEHEAYDVFFNPLLQDYYWNYAYLKKQEVPIRPIWKIVKRAMQLKNRQPALYVMSNEKNKQLESELEACHLEKLYTDVWMIFENPEKFANCETPMEVEISRVKTSEKNQFIQAVMDGFSDADDPYGILPEAYRKVYELEFGKNGEYSTLEYGGKRNGEMVATANVWYKGDCANIYTVSTKKKYQKQGICRKMMAYVMKDLAQKGIRVACVQTEAGCYTEKVYEKMGFEKVMLGEVYGQKARTNV